MKLNRIIHANSADEALQKFANVKKEFEGAGVLNMIYFDGTIEFMDLFLYSPRDKTMTRIGQIHFPTAQEFYGLEER